MKTLTHLRNRTEHSYRSATGKLESVVSLQQGKAAGITDRNGTWGHARWSAECKANGIKPILGVELAVVEDMDLREKQPANYMSFLAANNKGLQEIYELTTLSTEKFYYVPRIDYGFLEDVCKTGNVLALSGNAPRTDLIPAKMKNFFFELNQLTPPDLLAWAQGRNHQIVATCDNLYPRPEDKGAYEIILGSLRNTRAVGSHILDYWEWIHQWPGFDKAVALAESLAEGCNASLPEAEMVHPKVSQTLEQMCIAGAKKRKIDIKRKAYKDRLRKELDLIKEKKFEDYFFVVADMVSYAKEHMLVGPARGSSCGSLVCYLIGITDIDPLPYGLLFERFIDINREDLPDIDIDFQDDKREMVFDYLRTKYGHNNVSRLGTISVFKAKSAITDVAKQLLVPSWEVEDLKGSIIERSSGDSRAAFCILDTFEQLEVGRATLAKYPELRYAGEIEGHARHTGVHAAGIIITAHPVTNYCAVNVVTGAAMLDKKDAEKLNLLKIDALGLRTLSVVQDTLDQIGWTREDLHDYPVDDQKAFRVLNQGHFAGIFQFEGYALQSLTKQMTVDCLEDIVSITALARPGPLSSGGATEFMKRRVKLPPVVYLHAMTKSITEITYGIIVYQEQVMQIAREVGGLSWEDVSQLRKAMSKSLGKEYFDTYWERFKVGAAKNKVSEKDAKLIWDSINTMGSWAFNRSHAVAYGIMSYWCCALKASFPLEFAASCLRNAKDDDQSIKILRELVREGYSYQPYDRHHSVHNWSVQKGQLIGGLTAIKGIGNKLAESILRKRDNNIAFTAREEKLLAGGETPWDSVFEARDKWSHIRENPKAFGIESEIVDLDDITQDSDGTFVFIAKLTDKSLRDHNEIKSVEKRGGKKMTGQTLFLNLTLEDDSSSVNCSINKFRYEQYGLPIVEEGKIGDWYLWKGDNRKGFRRIYIRRWKKLTGDVTFSRPEKKLKKVIDANGSSGDNATVERKASKTKTSKTNKKKS